MEWYILSIAQLSTCHVLKELVYLCSLLICICIFYDTQKFLKLNHAGAVIVHKSDHFHDFFTCICKTQAYQWFLKFLYPNSSRSIPVELTETVFKLSYLTNKNFNVHNLYYLLVLKIQKFSLAMLDKPLSLAFLKQLLLITLILLLSFISTHQICLRQLLINLYSLEND